MKVALKVIKFLSQTNSLNIFGPTKRKYTYKFAILNDLEKLVQHPNRIPDNLGDTQTYLPETESKAGNCKLGKYK